MDDRIKMRKRWIGKPAFTLIELLVVISIIALLLSILMPALTKVKEQARIVVCKTNLHQWGLGLQTYMSDNNDKMLASVTWPPSSYGNFTSLWPNEIFLDSTASALPGTGPLSLDVTEEQAAVFLSQEVMAQYMPGFNEQKRRKVDVDSLSLDQAEDLRLDGVWACPAVNLDTLENNLNRMKEPKGYFRLHYSYFGRTDLFADVLFNPPNGPSVRKDFPGKDMNGKQMLMADTLFYWAPSDFWIYNHGKSGASNHHRDGTVTQSVRDVTGINKLFGDGAVNRKKISEFDPDVVKVGPEAGGGAITDVYPYFNQGGGGYLFY